MNANQLVGASDSGGTSLTFSAHERAGRVEVLEPTTPYVRPIMEIHRGADAFVTFHRKLGDQLENLGSLRTSELETIFPQFACELERDSYFSVNGFFRAGHCGACLPMLKPAYRRTDGARYLNACFVDIDFHDQSGPFDFGYCLGQVITLQDKKIIPPASLVMRSGRGLWLFWLLSSAQNTQIPPRAFPERVLAYDAVQKELIRRTGADRAASDVARITRVPGSINSNAFPGDPERVMMWTQRRADSSGYSYTLESLACFLDVQIPKLRPSRRAAGLRPEASERGLRGWRTLWQYRFEDFEILRQMRGGFSDGCRNRAAYIYSVILRGNGLDDDAVRKAVTVLGRECRPPLSEEAIKNAIEQSRESRRQLKDATIASYLNVTSEEARAIPRWAESKMLQRTEPVDMHLKPIQRAQLRRNTIVEIFSSLEGRLPSVRRMAALLQLRGIQTSHVQVWSDYRRLNLIPRETCSPLFPR